MNLVLVCRSALLATGQSRPANGSNPQDGFEKCEICINVFSVCMGSARILFSYEPESFVIIELMFLIPPLLFITLACVKENNTTSFITIFAVKSKDQYTPFNHLKT